MRVIKKNLGGGLFRFEPVATSSWECVDSIPSYIMDRIMEDVFETERFKQNNECKNTFTTEVNKPCCNEHFGPKKRSYAELDALNRFGEPDGIDVHVDRPLRENFESHHDWAMAMAKYRTLEDVAKDCDWECREPMRGVDFYNTSNSNKHCCMFDCNTCQNEWEWFDDDDDVELEETVKKLVKLMRNW
jgi:hypothetical protein